VLREAIFVAEDPNPSQETSPLSMLRGFFANPSVE
jgi:hypothetical protein